MIIRKFLTFELVLLTTIYSMQGHAQLPVDPSVVHGQAIIHTTSDHMTVINSPNTILNWQSFSIGADNSVYFQQHDAASMVLNRVTGNDPSNILGHLGSNGHIWLINPHGVLFGEHARIDAAGLMASTLDMTTLDFLSKRYQFNATDNLGQVRNQGEIRTSMGGQVWLLGNQVQNDGLIQTPGGQTMLAAGKSVELIDSGTPNLIVQVKAPENQTVNLGSLVAPGGQIDLHGSIVNQEGIVRASSIGTDAAGQVVLKADQVVLAANSQTIAEQGSVNMEVDSTLNNWGEINAKNIALTADSILQQGQIKSQGGHIDLTARSSTYLSGIVDVSNAQGAGGDIRLATNKLEGMAGGQLRADGEHGGHIRVTGNGMVGFSSLLSAVGSKQGGVIEMTGDQLYLLNADVNASGAEQGGTVHLGGGWQGSGDLPHAREVLIGTGSEVKANGGLGTTGKGGEIAVWSTQSSEHYGSLEARDGGRIELSSKDVVKQTGSIQAGAGGNILLDPKNLIISDSPPDSLTLARKFTLGSQSSPGLTLQNEDQFGTSVALEGDLLAVGARRDDTGGTDNGAVYLFKGASGEDFGGLTLANKLASGQGAKGMGSIAAGSNFGTSVALNAGRLAVGAELESTGSSQHGVVYLFSGAGSDFSNLQLAGTLTSATGASNMPALAAGDNFGSAVGLDGNHLVVGARSDNSSGAVHLFTIANSTDFSGLTWQGKVSSSSGASSMPGLSTNDSFGISVALEGDRLAVGAIQDDDGGKVNSGAVHLFTGVDTNFSNLTWKGKLTSGSGAIDMPVLADENRLGRAVALEGDKLVVGARVDDTGGTDRGAVFLFTGAESGFSGLRYQGKLASAQGAIGMPALADGDHFGSAVALDQGRLVVGADGSETTKGALYFFNGALESEIITDVTNVTFNNNPSGDSYIAPGTLVAMLNGGNTVTLQANNDITVQSDVTVIQGNGAGDIILRAGRNINLNANIVTNNADFTAIAGDKGANSAYTDAGTPAITINEKGNLNVGSGTIVLAVNAVDGTFTNLHGDNAITVNDAGRWLIYAANPDTSTEGFSKYQKHYNQGFDGVAPQYATSGNWFLYNVTPVLQVTPVGRTINAGESIPSSFDYKLSGFIDNDSTASAIDNDSIAEFLVKNSGSPGISAGSHDVAYNKGLNSTLGYQFADNLSSNNELTVNGTSTPSGKPGAGDTPNPVVKQNTIDTSIQAINTASASSRPVISPVAEGKVVDTSTTDSSSSSSSANLFDRMNVAKMNLLDLQQLIQQRRDYKNELFSDAISKLSFDPKLSDIPTCNSLAEVDSGLCRISEAQYQDMKVVKESLFNKNDYKVKIARLPQIKRKIIVLFGINNYNDQSIPVLNNAIYDTEVIGELFSAKLGYDVRIVRNATKADFIRTFNQLSLELEVDDSVVIYYAGHGYMNEKTGNGFWIPADASAKDPGSWISNTNVSEMLGNIASKQVVMISDSCYSGFFTKEQKLKMNNPDIQPDEILVKRSVVVMSSGSDEPVADDGRGGHSIFAWSLMQALDHIDNWKAGANIFEQIQNDVFKRFPQKPQYGAIVSAGHQDGGDYLFEFRQLEKNPRPEIRHQNHDSR